MNITRKQVEKELAFINEIVARAHRCECEGTISGDTQAAMWRNRADGKLGLLSSLNLIDST